MIDKLVGSATEAVADDLDLDRVVHLSYGDFSIGDYLVHTSTFRAFQAWSIAKFIGLDYSLPDPLVDGLWEVLGPQIDSFRAMGVFPPEIMVPEDSDAETRLLARVGYWVP